MVVKKDRIEGLSRAAIKSAWYLAELVSLFTSYSMASNLHFPEATSTGK